MNNLIGSLPLILPIVFAWAEKQETIILNQGQPLDCNQLADARRAGVIKPDKIRILKVDSLPHPDNDDIMFHAKQIGFFGKSASGLTFGYGIFLQHGVWEDRHTLVHECVHVGQYEKKDGIRPFLSEYLRECIEPGYPFGRLEQEAIHRAKDICKRIVPVS